MGVALFEAGPEDYSERVMTPLAALTLYGTALEYNYLTHPRNSLTHPAASFRILAAVCLEALPPSTTVTESDAILPITMLGWTLEQLKAEKVFSSDLTVS